MHAFLRSGIFKVQVLPSRLQTEKLHLQQVCSTAGFLRSLKVATVTTLPVSARAPFPPFCQAAASALNRQILETAQGRHDDDVTGICAQPPDS